MSALHRQVQQLNVIQKKILTELKKRKFSTEELQQAFKMRQNHIIKMETAFEKAREAKLSGPKKSSLKKLFKKCVTLSKAIQDNLDTKVDHYKNNLDDATSRRKAEDAYRKLR